MYSIFISYSELSDSCGINFSSLLETDRHSTIFSFLPFSEDFCTECSIFLPSPLVSNEDFSGVSVRMALLYFFRRYLSLSFQSYALGNSINSSTEMNRVVSVISFSNCSLLKLVPKNNTRSLSL